MGAFFFVRSLLMFVNNERPFAGNMNGWILAIFFFVDAWLLGKCIPYLLSLRNPVEQTHTHQHSLNPVISTHSTWLGCTAACVNCQFQSQHEPLMAAEPE